MGQLPAAVGAARAGQARRWLATFAAEFPQAKHVALGIDVIEISAVDADEFVATGLRLERSAVLTATAVNEPPHPNLTATYRELVRRRRLAPGGGLRAVLSEGEPGGEPAFLTARHRCRAGTDRGWLRILVRRLRDGQLVAQLGLVTDGSGIARYQNVETHPSGDAKGWPDAGLASRAARPGQPGREHAGHGWPTRTYVAIRVYRSVGFIDAETQVGFERQPG